MPDLDRRPAHRLTQAQAADLLGVSTARVAELVGQGRLTPVAKYARAGLLRADVERRAPGAGGRVTTVQVRVVDASVDAHDGGWHYATIIGSTDQDVHRVERLGGKTAATEWVDVPRVDLGDYDLHPGFLSAWRSGLRVKAERQGSGPPNASRPSANRQARRDYPDGCVNGTSAGQPWRPARGLKVERIECARRLTCRSRGRPDPLCLTNPSRLSAWATITGKRASEPARGPGHTPHRPRG